MKLEKTVERCIFLLALLYSSSAFSFDPIDDDLESSLVVVEDVIFTHATGHMTSKITYFNGNPQIKRVRIEADSGTKTL